MEKARVECPNCRIVENLEVPEDKCVQFHICQGCGYMMSAKKCCIICDFTDKKCPKPKYDKTAH